MECVLCVFCVHSMTTAAKPLSLQIQCVTDGIISYVSASEDDETPCFELENVNM